MTELMWVGIGCLIGAAGVGIWAVSVRARLLRAADRAGHERDVVVEQLAEARAESSERVDEVERFRRDAEEAQRSIVGLQEQLKAESAQVKTMEKHLAESKIQLSDAFSALGSKVLQTNSEQFLKLAQQTFTNLMTQAKGDSDKKHQAMDALMKPIKELLEKQTVAVSEIEKKREVAYTKLDEQIKVIAQQHGELRNETGRLVSALRRPEQRGRWGELQLENAVQLAGMSEHCDYDVQISARNELDELLRPDMAVNLPGGGRIVVDSKVAMDAYMDAINATDDDERKSCMKRHAEQVARHARQLSEKRYWNLFEHSPKLVVMFMPLESALVAALETRPDLHGEAMKNNVLIATPTLFVALLRAVAYGWQQESIATNAREIAKVGNELYERMDVFVSHFNSVGKKLEQATKSFNQATGSMERRLLPSARKLKELHATTHEEIEGADSVEIEVRLLDEDSGRHEGTEALRHEGEEAGR